MEGPKTQPGPLHALNEEQGEEEMTKEVKQRHDQKCFQSIYLKDATFEAQRKAQVALAHPTEKK